MIVGVSFGYHDSAAAAINNTEILFAAQEERYSREKFDPRFPSSVLKDIDKGIGLENVSSFILHEKPLVKLDRQLSQLLSGGIGDIKAFPSNVVGLRKTLDWRKDKLVNLISKCASGNLKVTKEQIKFSQHHLSHAAATFYTSPFEESLVFVSDAVGEWDSTSVWIGSGNTLKKISCQTFPHSIGLFYSAMTYFLGFKVNSGEYKLMGLAPYGAPRFVNELKEIINISDHGQITLDLNKFSYISGSTMTDKSMEKFFNKPRRASNEPINQWHADMAASVQKILEEVLIKSISYFLSIKGYPKKISLGGGVALNCVANSVISNKFGWENLHIFPAAGDSGGSAGAGLAYLSSKLKDKKTQRYAFNNCLLGAEPNKFRSKIELDQLNLRYIELIEVDLAKQIALHLSQGAIVAIFHGREEFGPRALGNRSILADARISKGQITLNEKIKFRESFRPFAPIVLEEYSNKWFDIEGPERFMLRTVQVKNFAYDFTTPSVSDLDYADEININERLKYLRSPIPSVTHLDGSARVQTLPKEDSRLVRKILEEFYKITGCPVLVNTSFNVRGEPIVHSPKDALQCFLTTGIDVLCLSDYLVNKIEQKEVFLRHEFVSAARED